MTSWLIEFLAFAFKGELPVREIARIGRVREAASKPDKTHADQHTEALKLRAVMIATWAICIFAGLALLAAIVLAVRGDEIPGFLSNVVFSCLGYLGGVLASYFGIKRAR
jgi:hypothetical protein